MSLQFVMGPSGSGKSHYLYQMVTEESLRNPDKNYFVLVPDQFTMQTQRDLVMANPRKGILNVDVLSFNRLAHRVFEETGGNQSVILDDVGKSFVLRKIAGDYEKKLIFLGSNLKKTGFISEVKSIISEFTQYDIQREDLQQMIEAAGAETSLGYKLQDLSRIYEGFQEYLRGKYITGEELLDVLCTVVPKSNILKNSVIVLDGFTGFTPVQNKLLRELLLVCEKVVVTITVEPTQKKFMLFDMSRKMEESLVKIAKECKVPVENPVQFIDKPVYRFRTNSALGFLESHLFRYSRDVFQGEQDSVQIFHGETVKEELDFVAQSIRRMVRIDGLHYRDVAVIVSDMNTYANYAERTFDSYGIPIFMDHKRSILLNSFVEYLRSLLSMMEQNFSYESVFRYLRTDLAGLDKKEVDELENYCVALGVRGYKQWQEKWIRRTRDMEESDLEVINQYRERFMMKLDKVVPVLKSRTKTVAEVTRALHDFLYENEIQQRVHEYEERFAKEGETVLEREYAQVYRIVMELFDKFVELLGEEKISLKEYCELLDAGLEEAKVGIIPPSLDQVVIGDIERTRIKDIKVLFFVGMNDTHIPGSADHGGLLSDYDREKLTATGVILAPGVKEKSFIQKFYLYLMLTKPSKQVVLTYCKTSAKGESQRQAYLISDLLKMYPKLKNQKMEMQLTQRELTSNSMIGYLVEGLRQKSEGLGSEWQELYTWYKKNPKHSKTIEQILEATFFEKPSTALTKKTAEKLYGNFLTNSVSRLEKFSACAYAHFLAYGLRLKERDIYQFRNVDMGKLLHSAIEKFSAKVKHAGYKWTDLSNDVREVFVKESVEESIVDYGNTILYSSERNKYTITRLERLVKRTVWAMTKQLAKGDFEPTGFEVTYDSGAIALNDENMMRVYGVIDRVDICETENDVYVKIVDYKSSKRELSLSKLYHGLQMQLIVYMNAAMEMEKQKKPEKQVIPAAMLYYSFEDPVIAKQSEETEREKELLKSLKPTGLVNESDAVISHLDAELSKTSEVIPVVKNLNGSHGAHSKVLSGEELQVLTDYADAKLVQIGNEIMDGKAEINPYIMDKEYSCEYCPYKGICGFDEEISGYQYRRLPKFDNAQAIEKMREEV